jgi:hypothetical protein
MTMPEPRRWRIYRYTVPGKNDQTGDNSTAFVVAKVEGPDTGPDPVDAPSGEPPWVEVVEAVTRGA